MLPWRRVCLSTLCWWLTRATLCCCSPRYVGLPSVHARYEILRSCVDELQRVQLLEPSTSSPILSFTRLAGKRGSRKRLAEQMDALMEEDTTGDASVTVSTTLLHVAELADGFSGRALRKLPFQAHAFFVQVRDDHPSCGAVEERCDLADVVLVVQMSFSVVSIRECDAVHQALGPDRRNRD